MPQNRISNRFRHDANHVRPSDRRVVEWLFWHLAWSEEPKASVREAAKASGISMTALDRARHVLGVETAYRREHAAWCYTLLPQPSRRYGKCVRPSPADPSVDDRWNKNP